MKSKTHLHSHDFEIPAQNFDLQQFPRCTFRYVLQYVDVRLVMYELQNGVLVLRQCSFLIAQNHHHKMIRKWENSSKLQSKEKK